MGTIIYSHPIAKVISWFIPKKNRHNFLMKHDINYKLKEGLFGDKNTGIGFCINHKAVSAWREDLIYHPQEHTYTTLPYVSAAGNAYYESLYFFDRLVVCYDLGIGYARKFINGITLFRYNGEGVELISKQSYYCRYFETQKDKDSAAYDAVIMLKKFLKGQAKLLGIPMTELIVPISREIANENQQKYLIEIQSKSSQNS